MINRALAILILITITFLSGCKMLGKNKKDLPNDGQLYGVEPSKGWKLPKPPGMVYIPSGTFHMGPSDEDVNFAFTARNKQVSISSFWMDATEVTNNEYRQFTNWVRDSIAAKLMGFIIVGKSGTDGPAELIDWKKARAIKWGSLGGKGMEAIEPIMVTADNRIFNKKEINPAKLVFHSETFDFKAAAQSRQKDIARSKFIIKKDLEIYPDTLCWVRDFAYSYNEPMAKKYYSHPAYGNYPVVGVSWKQATAFCEWRTQYLNGYLDSKKRISESDFRLPTEAQWEFAARGGRSQSPYPWGGPYLRNRKGCLLANFKPGRGNYPEDGGFYTVRADAYWPNDFGLYNMSGNVAEWTSSLFYEGGYNFQHDMNPEVRWDAKDTDPPRMKRKVTRGGSWKDVGYYLQTSARNYEYQDTTKSYIGFRCVIDLPPSNKKGK
jgi:sulfatase modifying factor 1